MPNVITSTILNSYPKAQLCKYEFHAHLHNPRQSVKLSKRQVLEV